MNKLLLPSLLAVALAIVGTDKASANWDFQFSTGFNLSLKCGSRDRNQCPGGPYFLPGPIAAPAPAPAPEPMPAPMPPKAAFGPSVGAPEGLALDSGATAPAPVPLAPMSGTRPVGYQYATPQYSTPAPQYGMPSQPHYDPAQYYGSDYQNPDYWYDR